MSYCEAKSLSHSSQYDKSQICIVENFVLISQKFFKGYKLNFLPIIFFLSTLSYAIDISLQPSNTKDISSYELNMKKALLRKKGILRVDETKLKEFLRSNRMLSDRYIKEFNTTNGYKKTLTVHKLQLEEELADLYIQNRLEQTPIDDETLLSYYVSHKEKFAESPKLTFSVYKFKDFQEAYEAYKENKFDKRDDQITIHYKNIDPSIKEMFKNVKEKDVLPPVFFRDSFVIFVIDKVQPKRDRSFKEVKSAIRNLLLNKIRSDFKKKLIKQADEEK